MPAEIGTRRTRQAKAANPKADEEAEKTRKKASAVACKGQGRARPTNDKRRSGGADDDSDSSDDESSGPKAKVDKSYDARTISDAKQLIKQQYRVVRAEYDERIAEEAKTFETWCNSSSSRRLQQTVKSNRPRVPFKVHSYPADGQQRHWDELYQPENVSVIQRAAKGRVQVQVVPCVLQPAHKRLPRMTYWFHIECNLKTEDSLRLSHIPFVSEDQDDATLCKELINLYEEGIHGYELNWDYINDYILHKLLEATKPIWRKDAEHLYFAVFKLFPNKLSYRQLHNAFHDFKRRFGSVNPAKFNVLDKSKSDTRDTQKENEHTVRTTICLQCATLDCIYHGYNPELVHRAKNEFSRRQTTLPLPPMPSTRSPKKRCSKTAAQEPHCSSDCYRHMSREVVIEKYLKLYPYMDADSIVDDRLWMAIDLRELRKRADFPSSNLETILCGFAINAELREDGMDEEDRTLYDDGESADPGYINDKMCWFARTVNTTFGANFKCNKLYELLLASGVTKKEEAEECFPKKKPTVKDMHRNFRSSTWADGQGKIDNVHRLTPCSHDGVCGQSNPDCSCGSSGVCTKFCMCGDECRIKFPGCRCAPGNCRTKQCQCFYAKWECDPAICKNCACDAPAEWTKPMCRNVQISRGIQKKIKVGVSSVAGWGAFIFDTAEKGDLVSEYTGELISAAEVERRGHIYDRFGTSYIFGLNHEQCIDANRMGNLIRFANHSNKHANCYSQILLVNGDHRVGIFAKRHIEPNEELFFDYSYNLQHKEQFVPKECPVEAIRNDKRKANGSSSSLKSLDGQVKGKLWNGTPMADTSCTDKNVSLLKRSMTAAATMKTSRSTPSMSSAAREEEGRHRTSVPKESLSNLSIDDKKPDAKTSLSKRKEENEKRVSAAAEVPKKRGRPSNRSTRLKDSPSKCLRKRKPLNYGDGSSDFE